MVSETWVAAYFWSDPQKEKTDTVGIWVAGNDHFISNVIVFSAKVGVQITGVSSWPLPARPTLQGLTQHTRTHTNTHTHTHLLYVHPLQAANKLVNVHTWNEATGNGGIGILNKASQNIFIGCYLDFTDFVLAVAQPANHGE